MNSFEACLDANGDNALVKCSFVGEVLLLSSPLLSFPPSSLPLPPSLFLFVLMACFVQTVPLAQSFDQCMSASKYDATKCEAEGVALFAATGRFLKRTGIQI